MKTTFFIVTLVILGLHGVSAQQNAGYSEETLEDAYEIINLQYPKGRLLEATIGSETQYDGEFLTYLWLNENNRERTPTGVLAITPFVDFDTLLTEAQKKELTWKFKHLPEVILDQHKVSAETIRQIDIEKNADNKEFFPYGIVSFPLIQEGKDGSQYGIIYEIKGIYPVSHPGSNMHVYRKHDGKWEYFCIVNVSV